MKSRTDAELTLSPDPATHHLHKFATYGKAQANSSVFAGHSLIDLAERLEETIHQLWSDTNARILNCEMNLVHAIDFLRGDCQLDLALFRKFYGIIQQIAQDLRSLLGSL